MSPSASYNPERKSPLYDILANKKHYGSLPPIYIQVCGMDPFRDEALVLERELRTKYNVKTRLDVYPGLPHAFWSFYPTFPATKKAITDVMDAISWLLEQKQ